MIYGPYGYNDASFFTLIENNAAHITRALREGRRHGATSMEVTEAAEESYMANMQSRRYRQVFADPSCQGTNSCYFNRHGDVPFRAATTPEAAPLARAVTDAHPAIAPDDAMAHADVIAQVAAAHVAFPVHSREVTVDRLTRVVRMVDAGSHAT